MAYPDDSRDDNNGNSHDQGPYFLHPIDGLSPGRVMGGSWIFHVGVACGRTKAVDAEPKVVKAEKICTIVGQQRRIFQK